MSLAWRPRVPPNARRRRAGMQAKSGGPFPPVESLDSVVPAATVAARDQAPVQPGSAANGSAVTTQARVGSANGTATPGLSPGTRGPGERQPATGPIDWLMSYLIRKLAWSKLSEPRIAIAVSGVGLLLGMVVGATAQNTETLPLRLPLSTLLHSLQYDPVIASVLLYTGNVLACLGLAGMLWAHSQGWRPDPRRLLLASAGIVAVMVSLTPVGSSDTASYAAYGRIAALGGNPDLTNPQRFLGANSPYQLAVGVPWKATPCVYGPEATLRRRHECNRTAGIAGVAFATIALDYSFYGLTWLAPLVSASKLVTLPSPWWFVHILGQAFHADATTASLISVLWPISVIAVAIPVYRRISSDQPRRVVAPFALTFASIVVSPWVFAWYTAIAWVALTQVPRNRMTRWLTLVTVWLALWHSSGGQPPPTRL